MVFVKKKNDCGMAAKWILGNKKDGAKNAARNKTERKKHSEYIKGIKLQICRRAKKYGGDSPSGLAANAPFRSALSSLFNRG